MCDQCPKTFVRSDLLFRHKDRHAKKAMRKNAAAQTRHLKTIRPARSNSSSSREDNSPPSPTSTQYSRSYETASSVDENCGHERNLSTSSHPRSFLQSPFAQDTFGSRPLFEEHRRDGMNTLPLPVIPLQHQDHQPLYKPFDFTFPPRQDIGTPVLPPIRESSKTVTKTRTYSVESILNDPI